MKVSLVTYLALLLTHTGLIHASSSTMLPSASINTFMSQGYTQTSDNNLYGKSQDSYGSFSLREFGLNASANITPSFFTSAQILARNTGHDEDNDISLDYALVDYSHSPSEFRTYGIRLGRIKNPLGFYNETRDVAFTRPSVILPQSIYFDRTRDLALSADGIHVYNNAKLFSHNSELTIGILKPRIEDKSTTKTLLGQSVQGSLKNNTGYVWKAELNTTPYTLSLSGANLELTYNGPEILADKEANVRFLINILSFQYDSEHISITSEYADRRFKFTNMESLTPFKKQNGESFYLQVTTLSSLKFKYFVRYDVLYQNKDDRNGNKLSRLTNGNRPNHSQFAKDWTLGMRWDINRFWVLSIEHHWINGTAWLPFQNNPLPSETKKTWRLFAGNISFRY